jgi:hypothetical protein
MLLGSVTVISRCLLKLHRYLSDYSFRIWTILFHHEGSSFLKALTPINQITSNHIPQDPNLDFAVSDILLHIPG